MAAKKLLLCIKLIIANALLLSVANAIWAVPANPFPHTYTQPCGTVIEYFLVGDEFFHYTKTPDGYVIAFDEKTEYYCYAKQVDFLVLPTNCRVGVDAPPEIDTALIPENLIRRDAYIDKNIKLIIHNSEIDIQCSSSVEQSAVYLPARVIFEALNYTVDWENETKTVIITASSDDSDDNFDNFKISLQINSDIIIINDESIQVENCPKLINSKTLLPLSIFEQILGKENIHIDLTEEDIVVNLFPEKVEE